MVGAVRWLALLAVAMLLLAACAGGSESDAASTIESDGTATSGGGATPVSSAAMEPATVTVSATVEGGPYSWELDRDGRVAGVLLRSGQPEGWTEGQWWNDHVALLPLDAATGQTLPGYDPIRMRRPSDFTASPEGRLLAFRQGSQYFEDSRLQVMDGRLLAIWEGAEQEGSSPILDQVSWEVDGELRKLRGLSIVTWSADGTRLLGLRGAHGNGDGELWRIEPRTGSAELLANVALAGSYPWRMSLLSPDRGTLYLPRYDGSGCCGIKVEGDPYIVVLDLDSGEVRGRIELPGLAIGQGFETLFDGQEEYNVLRYPGLAISPDGAWIYIVHSDEDQVTVVDTVRTVAAGPVEIGRSRSALAGVGGWLVDRFAGRAEAKGGIYRTKVAEVSADGRWLYISGGYDTACKDEPYFSCVSGNPVGLQVVDLQTMELVHEEREVNQFRVSPDGQRLLGWGQMTAIRDDPDDDENNEVVTTAFGLKILDAETFELIAHLVPGETAYSVTFSPDGRRAYFLTEGSGRPDDLSEPCTEDCTLLSVVELESGEVVATRMFGEGWFSLVSIAP